jgi:hypothetical protein
MPQNIKVKFELLNFEHFHPMNTIEINLLNLRKIGGVLFISFELALGDYKCTVLVS